jgi:hypothetical protein
VTRPGLSFIASGLAVELAVALLQSSDGNRHVAPSHKSGLSGASADDQRSQQERDDCIPHQIRGNVRHFNQIDVTVSRIEDVILLFDDSFFCRLLHLPAARLAPNK